VEEVENLCQQVMQEEFNTGIPLIDWILGLVLIIALLMLYISTIKYMPFIQETEEK